MIVLRRNRDLSFINFLDPHFIFYNKIKLIFLVPFYKGLITTLEKLLINSIIHIYVHLFFVLFSLIAYDDIKEIHSITDILTLGVPEQTL